jgi:formate hydrogenlyase subunit 6/NADH:ubiquinone oxidoreductase subunit I
MRFGWVIEGLRTGIVTTTYPARPDASIDPLRVRPVLFAERCQAVEGCDACIQACLPQALALEQTAEGRVFTLEMGRCIGCGLCAAACPNDAISMTSDVEQATHTAASLRQATLLAAQRPPAERRNT